VPSVSTGELLRRETEKGTALGHAVQEIMARGQLVSDELVTRVLAAHLCSSAFRNGFVLDGYPRTVSQAELLEDWLEKRELGSPRVVYLDVTSEEVTARLANRVECPVCGATYGTAKDLAARGGICEKDGTLLVHRLDDHGEAIMERFRHRIPAMGTPDEVFTRVVTALTADNGAIHSQTQARMMMAASVAG
jgi:adenylate kinase